MNKIILIGNVVNTPEAYTTKSGVQRSSFRIAVQRRFPNSQGEREADFLNVVAWRQNAEFCNKYLDKGRRIAVEGSLQTRQYDANDGSRRTVYEIIADSVEALSAPTEGQRAANNAGAPSTPPPKNVTEDGFQEVDDDQLPF